MRQDPTLWTVGAWNDNGIKDRAMVTKTICLIEQRQASEYLKSLFRNQYQIAEN